MIEVVSNALLDAAAKALSGKDEYDAGAFLTADNILHGVYTGGEA